MSADGEATTPRASLPQPDNRRRRKHAMYLKHKARKHGGNAGETPTEKPLTHEVIEAPGSQADGKEESRAADASQIKHRGVASPGRKKALVKKLTEKKTPTEKPMTHEVIEAPGSQADGKEESRAADASQIKRRGVTSPGRKKALVKKLTEKKKASLRQGAVQHVQEDAQEKEDDEKEAAVETNETMEAVDKTKKWDTRSILEHPLDEISVAKEEVDPSWNLTGAAHFDVVNDTEENHNRDEDLDMFDTASWAVTESGFSTLSMLSKTDANADIERIADQLALKSSSEENPTGSDVSEPWDVSKAAFAKKTDSPRVDEEDGIDIFDTASWAVTEATFSSVSLSKLPEALADIEKEADRLEQDESDNVKATDHKTLLNGTSPSKLDDIEEEAGHPAQDATMNALKDNEMLLDSSDVRSDVFDGIDDGELSTIEQERLQQERIETYITKDDRQLDSSIEDSGEGNLEGDSDGNESADDGGEINYVAADSEEEQEDENPNNATEEAMLTGFEPSGENKVATFTAAAIAATSASGEESFEVQMVENDPSSKRKNKSERKKIELGNLEMIDSNSVASSKGSSIFKDESVVSSLIGETLLASVADGSTRSTSALVETTRARSTVSKYPQTSMAESLKSGKVPPPTIDSDSTPMANNTRKKLEGEKLVMKIPPPPEHKLRKWEEDKMRPAKHLEAVARAKKVRSRGEFEVDEPAPAESLETRAGTAFADKEQEASVTAKQASSKSEFKVEDLAPAENDTGNDNGELKTGPKSGAAEKQEASSVALPNPPEVNRKTLEDALELAPGADGVWNGSESNLLPDSWHPPDNSSTLKGDSKVMHTSTSSGKHRSPRIYDRKIAEKLLLASSAAARKFESYVAQDDNEVIAIASTALTAAMDEEAQSEVNTSADNPSFFCSPDTLRDNLLSVTSSSNIGAPGGEQPSNLCSPIKGNPLGGIGDGHGCSPTSKTDTAKVDRAHDTGLELVGGAFSPWKNSEYAPESSSSDDAVPASSVDHHTVEPAVDASSSAPPLSGREPLVKAREDTAEDSRNLLRWLQNDVLRQPQKEGTSTLNHYALSAQQAERHIASILENIEQLNALCKFVSDEMNACVDKHDPALNAHSPMRWLQPFSVPTAGSDAPKASILAANFVSFLHRVSRRSNIPSPFGDENPFLLDLVGTSIKRASDGNVDSLEIQESETMQSLLLNHEMGGAIPIVLFLYESCRSQTAAVTAEGISVHSSEPTLRRSCGSDKDVSLDENPRFRVPNQSPSPFETACEDMPSIVPMVLGFLGDPVAVCRAKMVNRMCTRVISNNEHVIMRDAVRLGGLSMHVRPAFWMWITLEKCERSITAKVFGGAMNGKLHIDSELAEDNSTTGKQHNLEDSAASASLSALEKIGREGKWHHVIQRDVARAFGNMPPHKTGARLRTDSIVRALVTWGRSRLLKHGVKGGGEEMSTPRLTRPTDSEGKQRSRPSTAPPPWEAGKDDDASNTTPVDTVSDWGGISPVGSFTSNTSGFAGDNSTSGAGQPASLGGPGAPSSSEGHPKSGKNSKSIEELALSGNALTDDMKVDLQNQLGFILHALAAAHDDVGYCQGMDYIVAHLLRVLQDTVRWRAVRGTLPAAIHARPEIPPMGAEEADVSARIDVAIEKSLLVEETVFRVMDTFFTTYNLRHMFWPELRCLKTCCRVFERLIQLKLPVLADHFEHHDLNVGLFALGWFQTLFLYLPSMPSATVCHMWDIWLVERSFKIFFRVGTAILFLSQPILLNHELEGMMTYLNTFPDATLLNPDILIACALQIKVTNRMLAQIEEEVTGGV